MAGIIKASGPNSSRVVSGELFHFDDVSSKANQYLEQVKREAAQIVQRAKDEAEQLRRAAEEQGRQAGMKSAEQAVKQRVQQTVQQELSSMLPVLQSAVDAVQQAKQEWIGHWEHNVVRLATKIAERVIRREVAAAPEIALTLIRESLELSAGNKKLRLHLSPSDYELFGEHAKQLANQINKLGETEIVQDASISVGGCKVSTEFGTIDNSLEAQLDRIEEELR